MNRKYLESKYEQELDSTKYDQCPKCGSFSIMIDMSVSGMPAICSDCGYKNDIKEFRSDVENEIY